MNIAVFEVSNDERAELDRLARTLDVNLRLVEGNLSMDTLSSAEGCEAVSTLGRSRLNREVLGALKGMGIRYASTRTIGVDHIDLAAAKENGIRVSHASYPPDAVADFTLMLILMVLRRYKPAMWRQQVNDYSLFGLMGRSLRRQTVGVVGTGSIGAAVIRSLAGFGCRILAYNLVECEELRPYATFVDLDTLYRESDIITFHVPATPETRRMVNRESLSRMKDGVILINTARGELMDIDAVTEGIETEKIGSLAMDVFENEQGIYHADRKTDILRNKDMVYLRQFPNVVLTQHMAFYTEESIISMVDCGIESLLDMKAGRPTKLEVSA
ncbi:D-isomer specific 2-hydroxyacid dehydrogenase family protein [Mailhella massiliensis]|uniref:D-isomer specific 2-hydroxyacid dehydrogenase family protein n=1 Tax=Mailhella massiliensis TaxID=1903261 RepID=UPI00097DF99E|nr:D-isomer specific 2-hydroxyacid dehydrogenase family protein [Mailhella massiliensis]